MAGLVNLPPDEWSKWASYFGELFPTAGKGFIDDMCARMIRTLACCRKSQPMLKASCYMRLCQFGNALKELEHG